MGSRLSRTPNIDSTNESTSGVDSTNESSSENQILTALIEDLGNQYDVSKAKLLPILNLLGSTTASNSKMNAFDTPYRCACLLGRFVRVAQTRQNKNSTLANLHVPFNYLLNENFALRRPLDIGKTSIASLSKNPHQKSHEFAKLIVEAHKLYDEFGAVLKHCEEQDDCETAMKWRTFKKLWPAALTYHKFLWSTYGDPEGDVPSIGLPFKFGEDNLNTMKEMRKFFQQGYLPSKIRYNGKMWKHILVGYYAYTDGAVEALPDNKHKEEILALVKAHRLSLNNTNTANSSSVDLTNDVSSDSSECSERSDDHHEDPPLSDKKTTRKRKGNSDDVKKAAAVKRQRRTGGT